jgi:hypothetical protein
LLGDRSGEPHDVLCLASDHSDSRIKQSSPVSLFPRPDVRKAVTAARPRFVCNARMADVLLEAGARRPRLLVDLGWALPVVSIFVTATFKGGTKSLHPEIHVGRVVASVAEASIEMLLPFGRSGRQLFWSGGAAVMGVDAVGGPPDGDFTNESGAQRAALRHPIGLSAVVGVMSNVVGEVGDELGPPGQVLPPVGVIVDRLGNSG